MTDKKELAAADLEANQKIDSTWEAITLDGLEDEDWSSIDDPQYFMSIPGMVESIWEAANQPIEECISWEELERELADADKRREFYRELSYG